MALVSCSDTVCQHRDADDNSLCDKCSDSYTDGKDIEECKHSYISSVIKNLTCTEDGEKTYSCSKCGYSYSEVLTATGHEHTATVTQPTCTEDGYTTYTCHCGDSYVSDHTNALGHTEVIDKAVESTCTETGLTKGKHCSVCDEVLVAQKVVEALGHDYIDHEARAETCTSVGWEAYQTCSRCDYSTYEEIAALGHDYVDHEGKPATCYEDGWEAYQTCSRCDYNSYVELPASHSIENGYCTVCKLPESTPGLEFEKNEDGTYTVTGIGDCQETSISIGIYKDSYVTSIDYEAFYGCTSITSVTIGNSVTSIGDRAFCDCISLASVTIGNSVTSIGDWAFNGCYKLVEVINKSSLNITKGSWEHGHISYYALCVHNGESKIITVGNYLFITHDNVNYLLGYTGTATDITLPESHNGKTYEIYNYAFSGCDSLTSVTIPNSVTTIGNYAFYGCSSLTSVTIPDSVTSIGDCAFADCTRLTSITIPDSVTSIGSYAFAGCDSLTSVTIGNSVTSIGYDAFDGCTSLTYNEYDNAYYLGNEENPFYVLVKAKNANITSCSVHNDTKVIAGSAFSGCESLTSITIPNSVTSIGDSAFRDCSSLKSVIIPDSVTSIGGCAFWKCRSLTSITIPNGVTSIGEHAFEYCTSLKSVTIGDSVTSIGYGAFRNCLSLTSVTFENPDGWWYTEDSSATSGTSITGLSDASTAAQYLRSTYCDYYWRRG